MKTVLVAALGCLLVSVPASAQSASELSASLKAMQLQIDRLQALVKARTALPDSGQLVYLDYGIVDGSTLLVEGWGFECNTQLPGTIDIAINGVVVKGSPIERRHRADVRAWSIQSGACEENPKDVGAIGSVNLANYAPGTYIVQLRLRNDAGITVKSNVRTFMLQ
jgi:hypothetical protein